MVSDKKNILWKLKKSIIKGLFEEELTQMIQKYAQQLKRGEDTDNTESHMVTRNSISLQYPAETKQLKQDLIAMKNYLRQSQKLVHIGSWHNDLNLNRTCWSEETYEIFKVRPDEFDGTYEAFLKMVHPDDVLLIQNTLRNPRHKPFTMEFRIIRSDGEVRDIYQVVEFAFDEQGHPNSIYGTVQDITEQKRLDLQQNRKIIDEMQNRFHYLVQESSDVYGIITPEGLITYISPAVSRVLDIPPGEKIGKNLLSFYEEKESRKLKNMISYVLKHADKTIKRNILYTGPTGNKYLEVNMKNFVSEPLIKGIVINFRDITERVIIEDKVAYLANHDELTGLPNRVFFDHDLKNKCQQALAAKSGLALMMIDIREINYINDVLGYDIGNQVVMQITDRLKALLGQCVYRYSEDHFAVVLSGKSARADYKRLAGEIISLFHEAFHIDKHNLQLTASIGISIITDDAKDDEELKNHALAAMLQAKENGRLSRYVFYTSDATICNFKRTELTNNLHKAIEQNQLRVYYQPIVNIKTNEIVAVEALAEWEKPSWGMVSTKELISIAEESGFIIELGNWVLQEVCQNYKKWTNSGLPTIKVSVNYSSVQLMELNFAENIKAAISSFGLDPNFLIIEIMASSLMSDPDKAAIDIQKLKSFGIELALDNFGTDYSSFSYLRSYNIDYIKIDSSFVSSVPSDETGTLITKAIIELAHNLRIKLVADGIENWEQLSYLRQLNCHIGQGYLYSKPLLPDEFEKVLARGKCKPFLVDSRVKPTVERRKYFRVSLDQLLEAEMTILKIKGIDTHIGNSKVLIKNIGPGGLCYISNQDLPVSRNIVLLFKTQLLGKEIRVSGFSVWKEEIGNGLYENGIEFIMDENERTELIKELNQVQVKKKNNIFFAEGSFISMSAFQYFKVTQQ